MRKTLGAVFGAALMAAAVVGVPAVLTGETGPDLPACASDDADTAVVCYWDAVSQGNGKGESFIGLPVGDGAVAAYTPAPVPDGTPAQCESDLGGMPSGAAYCAWRYTDGTTLVFNITGDVVAYTH